MMEGLLQGSHQMIKHRLPNPKTSNTQSHIKQSHVHPQVGAVVLYGVPIVSLVIESQERLCLAQISNTLLKDFSYNEIHNRRVALGITCVQCTPVQLEILRRAGAMPVSSRRCGMITRREAERLCKSFLGDNAPPRLPDDFAFSVHHECAWGCRGAFLPSRYNSSRAKCIKCSLCGLFFSPNKFIFHSHRTSPTASYVQPDAANFNSWRRHLKLSGSPPEHIVHAWEDVKAMFNGGTRKRMLSSSGYSRSSSNYSQRQNKEENMQMQQSPGNETPKMVSLSPTPPKQIKLDSPPSTPVPYPPPTPTPTPVTIPHRVPPFPDLPLPLTMMDYVWHGMEGLKPPFLSPYLPWFGSTKRTVLGFPNIPQMGSSHDAIFQQMPPLSHQTKLYHQSAFRPVYPAIGNTDLQNNNTKRSSPYHLPKKIRIPLKKNEKIDDTRYEDIDIIQSNQSDGDESSQLEHEKNVTLKNEVTDDSYDSIESLKEDQMRSYHSDSKYRNDQSSGEKEISLNIPADASQAEDYSTKKRLLNKDSVDAEETDEDETVDIETTDDLPAESTSTELEIVTDPKSDNEGSELKRKSDSPFRQSSLTPPSTNHRIWTIARFSLEDSSRFEHKPSRSDYLPENSREEDLSNRSGGLQEPSNGISTERSPKIDYMKCCPTGLTES